MKTTLACNKQGAVIALSQVKSSCQEKEKVATETQKSKNMKVGNMYGFVFLLVGFLTACQSNTDQGALIYKDDFDQSLDSWVIEGPSSPNSSIGIVDGKLVVDVDAGATIWLDKKLSAPFVIEYKRTVVLESGKNDRLSDLNQFWMATDPRNENLFTRSGVFEEYDSLSLYYVGVGGNTNTTTRFRKYTGDGNRVLLEDLTDKENLLEANKEYTVKITVADGTSKYYMDDRLIFSYEDPQPLTIGYFGFRTTQSRQVIDDLRIYKWNQ